MTLLRAELSRIAVTTLLEESPRCTVFLSCCSFRFSAFFDVFIVGIVTNGEGLRLVAGSPGVVGLEVVLLLLTCSRWSSIVIRFMRSRIILGVRMSASSPGWYENDIGCCAMRRREIGELGSERRLLRKRSNVNCLDDSDMLFGIFGRGLSWNPDEVV